VETNLPFFRLFLLLLLLLLLHRSLQLPEIVWAPSSAAVEKENADNDDAACIIQAGITERQETDEAASVIQAGIQAKVDHDAKEKAKEKADSDEAASAIQAGIQKKADRDAKKKAEEKADSDAALEIIQAGVKDRQAAVAEVEGTEEPLLAELRVLLANCHEKADSAPPPACKADIPEYESCSEVEDDDVEELKWLHKDAKAAQYIFEHDRRVCADWPTPRLKTVLKQRIQDHRDMKLWVAATRTKKMMKEKKAELLSAFDLFDMDADGTVCKSEFRHAMMEMGAHHFDNDHFEATWARYDADGSGRITYEEFVKGETERIGNKHKKEHRTNKNTAARDGHHHHRHTPEIQLDNY
jgi:hypothetical protein